MAARRGRRASNLVAESSSSHTTVPSTSTSHGTGYKCIPCSNSSLKFKYEVCFIALHGTDEAEMVSFGDIARRMIGKPVQQLLRTSTGPTAYPPDIITKLVSLRFTFAVNMTRQSYYRAQKTYNITALVTAHGHPAAAPGNAAHDGAGDGNNHHAGATESGDSSNKSDSQETLEPLTPVTPATSLSSPDLSKTPPPKLDGVETPVSNKRGRGGRSKGNKTPASRRKLLLPDDDEATDAALDAPDSSVAGDKAQASGGEHSSPEHSLAPVSA